MPASMHARGHLMRPRAGSLLAALAWFIALPAVADVFVIAHPSVQVSGEDIREIFLGDRQFAGQIRLIPVDNAPAQERFLSRVMAMDGARYNSSWTKKSFRHGLNPPPVKSGDSEVLDFVRRTPGAVGYVIAAPSGVNVIQKY